MQLRTVAHRILSFSVVGVLYLSAIFQLTTPSFAQDGASAATVVLGRGEITGIVYAPDGKNVIVSSGAGISIYDVAALTDTAKFIETPALVHGVAISPDGKPLLLHRKTIRSSCGMLARARISPV